MLNLYITSTIRGEGKTFISAGLAATMQSLGYKTCVYKPIQTGGIEINGFTQSPDLTYIKTVDPYIGTHFTYLFKDDAEPLIAAENENKYIDLSVIIKDYKRIYSSCECTIIDGDKGILSPIAPATQNADMIKRLQAPVLYLVSPRENAVNDILNALYTAEIRGIRVSGVVINNIQEGSNSNKLTSLVRLIEEYSNVKVLGMVPNLGGNVEPDEMITGILNGVDIESVFNVKIEKLEFN